MITADDILYAVLALDAYNRGYDRSLEVSGTLVGDAAFVAESETTAGSAA